MKKQRRCEWRDCARPPIPRDCRGYCTEHREEARRNVLRALGTEAPKSLMWREGDEAWLLERAS